MTSEEHIKTLKELYKDCLNRYGSDCKYLASIEYAITAINRKYARDHKSSGRPF